MDSKEYILNLKAQLQDMASSGLITLNKNVDRVGMSASEAGTKTQDMGSIIEKAGQRALIVAPIWMAIRTAMMLVINTIKDMITANLELETNMAKIQASLRGTTAEITIQMSSIKGLLLDTASKSSISANNLGIAYIELQRIFQNTALATKALASAETLMITTGIGAKEAGKIIAETYIQAGNSIGKALTPTEKLQKIVDSLSYTQLRQGAGAQQVIASYEKLAPFLSGTNDKYTDMITLLGFLNTRFVESGRAGQALSTEIVNLSKNSKQLAEAFHINLNPNEPLSVIGVFTQIHEKLKESTELSTAQSKAIASVFGATRSSAPAREILTYFDELIAKLKDSQENMDGFAEKARHLIEATTVAQLQQFKNILGVMANDFITGATNGRSFAETLKDLNIFLQESHSEIHKAGSEWGTLVDVLIHLLPFTYLVRKGFREMLAEKKAMAEEEANIDKAIQLSAEKQAMARKKVNDEKEATQKAGKELTTKEELVIEKELASLLSTMGASEVQILEAKIQETMINKANLDDTSKELELTKLRFQQIVAIAKEREKEVTAESNLAYQYEKADEMERGRLRRMMELRLMPTEDIVKQFQTSGYDARIIEEYRTNFTKQQQETIGKLLETKHGLPTGMPEEGLKEVPEEAIKRFQSGASVFWDEWDSKEKTSIDIFGKDIKNALTNAFTGLGELAFGGMATGIQSRIYGYEPVRRGEGVNVPMTINVNIPEGGAYSQWKAEVEKRVKDLIEHDAQIQRSMTKIVTNTKP